MSPMLPPDERLRALQLQAEQSVSPVTLARLRSARQGPAPSRRMTGPSRWLPMAVAAGLALLAVGVHLQAPSPAPSTLAPGVAAMQNDDGVLDESPDLYLWLGATDLAME